MTVASGNCWSRQSQNVFSKWCFRQRQRRFEGCVGPAGYGTAWSMSQNSAARSQLGNRQVRSRHRTNSSNAVEGRYPGSGAESSPGWRTCRTRAPRRTNSASRVAGTVPPLVISAAGRLSSGGLGSGSGASISSTVIPGVIGRDWISPDMCGSGSLSSVEACATT